MASAALNWRAGGLRCHSRRDTPSQIQVARAGLSSRQLPPRRQRVSWPAGSAHAKKSLAVTFAAADEEASPAAAPQAAAAVETVESSTDSTKTPTEAAQAVSSEAPQDGPKPKTASTKVAKTDPEVSYSLNILWQEQFCAVSVDQIVQKGTKVQRTPVTEYYFWPKVDAWEELKKTLDAKEWISETYACPLRAAVSCSCWTLAA